MFGQKSASRGFSDGSVVENPPVNAGDSGSIPDSGKSPQAAEQLSPRVTAIEPVLYSLRPTVTEARAPQQKQPSQQKKPQQKQQPSR